MLEPAPQARAEAVPSPPSRSTRSAEDAHSAGVDAAATMESGVDGGTITTLGKTVKRRGHRRPQTSGPRRTRRHGGERAGFDWWQRRPA